MNRLFVDGGEMGALMRAHDWSLCPLGHPRGWPVALRNAINLMLNSPESMYIVWGPDLTFFFNDAYRPILGPRREGALGRPFLELWADAWEAVRAPLEAALQGRASRFVDVPITMARQGIPEETWWTYSYSPIHDGEAIQGVFCYTTETTERVRAARDQDLVNQEISHRLKNTMAMVQAIVTQTLREASGEVPVGDLMSRLQALATAHDVLLQRAWDGASLRTLVEGVLAPFDAGGRVQISGPAVEISSRATLATSLVLHELGTNALKYGALSAASGQVEVAWETREEGGEPTLRLAWRERGGPPAAEPSRRGFGSRLVRLGLLGTGGAESRFLPEGLEVDMVASLAQLRAP